MEVNLRSAPAEIGVLRPGDRVLIMSPQGNILVQGDVDDLAPRFDLVWVLDERLGERKIFIGSEHVIQLVVPNPVSPSA